MSTKLSRADRAFALAGGLKGQQAREAAAAKAALETAVFTAWVAAGRPATTVEYGNLRVAVIAVGIVNKSYSTVRYGWVHSFSGRAEVSTPEGKLTIQGHRSTGDAETLTGQGYISFTLSA